ncbi:unnamed protein product [Meloidogyne enterolobii]|uniref:Uncharacterized protein n=1 Tax=Meloidogyne enterolobii TaxID=390850 RepID=A0ACB1AXM6_MELEN
MDRPFIRLAPIKVEIIHFEPLVVIFRNVMSDEEIKTLINISLPSLHRSVVQNSSTGGQMIASYRISKKFFK